MYEIRQCVSKPFTLHYTSDVTKSEMWGFSWYWP